MASPLIAAPRSTPRDSLRWMRIDFPFRVVPFLLLPLLLAASTPISLRDLGVTLGDAPLELLLAAVIGPVMGWLAWLWRRKFVRFMVVPTDGDLFFQSAYYVLLNGPAEELLFRGLGIGWLGQHIGPWPAWLLSTLVFGLYHIPAGWGPRAVLGVTIGGGIFGVLFLVGPGAGSLLLPVVVHGFATCGFLSAGPWLAYALEVRRGKALG